MSLSRQAVFILCRKKILDKNSPFIGFFKDLSQLGCWSNGAPKRTLFCSEHLGIDSFQRQRFMMANVTKDEKTEFFDKVHQQFESAKANCSPSSATITLPSSFTFTEDLKLALNLAENHLEVDLVVKMAKNYNSQKLHHSHLTYIFGPLVMRLLHLFNQPALAYQLFTDATFQQTGFFAQVSSGTILLDLLLENNLHPQLLHAFNILSLPVSSSSSSPPSSSLSSSSPSSSSLSSSSPSSSSATGQQQQQQLHRIPADHLTILAASCFRQNTKECLERIRKFVVPNNNNNVEVSSRTYVYASMLAYNQGEAKVGLEILRKMPKDSKVTNTPAYLNAMALLLGSVGEAGKAVLLLEAMVAKMDVFQEVLTSIQGHCKDNLFLTQRITTLAENLRNSGTLLPISFQNYLNSTIRTPKALQNSFKSSRIARVGVDRSKDYFPISKSRPGLK